MHLPAMSIFDDNSFIPAASVSEFCCVDPQQWRLAPVQPFWQLPYLPFDAPLGQMMADYVPPVDPEILVRFMLSPAYCSAQIILCSSRVKLSDLQIVSAIQKMAKSILSF
jgi:hypothetical protein